MHLDPEYALCSLCHMEMESLEHLFFTCLIARVIWRESPWPSNTMVLGDLSNVDWVKIILDPAPYLGIPKKHQLNFTQFGIILMDSIWFTRNQIVDGKSILDVLRPLAAVKRLY